MAGHLRASGRLFKGLGLGAGFASGLGLAYSRWNYDVKCEELSGAQKNKVVIIGGGTAGVGVSAQLINDGIINITVIEPSPVHYYQPLWTLVGAGIKKKEESAELTSNMLKKEVTLLAHSVLKINPNKKEVELDDGTIVSYDYLVVAAGIQANWNAIPGKDHFLRRRGTDLHLN